MGSPTFYVNQKFLSFASLRKHVKHYERCMNCKLSITKSRTILSSSLTNINKELIYYEIQYSCSQNGDSKTIFKPQANERRAISTCNAECPVKLSLRASLDGKALEVYSFIGEHNHEISEEEDKNACIETYNENVAVKNYLEKMQERFKSEAAEKKNQLAMTESLIKILKNQIDGFSSTLANYQEDLRQTEDKVIKVHKQLQPENSIHNELALKVQRLKRRSSTCEDKYNHVVAIKISLNKMMEEYKCDMEEKNKQLAKTESLMESLNGEIENFNRRKKRSRGDLCRVEDDDMPNKLKVTENSSRRRSTEVNTNPALEDIMQIAAAKRSLEKVEKECKAKENEELSSDHDSVNMDNASSHNDSDISESTNTAVSSIFESDTDSEPIAPKPSSSAPIRRVIHPFAMITYPKKGSLANQNPVRIIRRAGSMVYIKTNKENEKVPEPPSSVPAVMPVTLPRPSLPVNPKTNKENEKVPEPPSSAPAVMPVTVPRPSLPEVNPKTNKETEKVPEPPSSVPAVMLVTLPRLNLPRLNLPKVNPKTNKENENPSSAPAVMLVTLPRPSLPEVNPKNNKENKKVPEPPSSVPALMLVTLPRHSLPEVNPKTNKENKKVPKPPSSAPAVMLVTLPSPSLPEINPKTNMENEKDEKRCNEKIPEPPSSVPEVMPVTLPGPSLPEVNPIPAENRCYFCYQPFGDPDMALEHLKTHHLRTQTGCELHKCHLCPYTNAKLYLLKHHLMICHYEIREHTRGMFHQCMFCPYSSTTLNGIQLHTRTHTEERSFQCNLCQRKFTQASGLILHKKNIHSHERPFVCPVCCMAFKLKFQLKSHYKTMHFVIKHKK